MKRESCDYTPGVSYKALEGTEQWTPVVRRKRTKLKVSERDSDSDSSGSEVDVLCSRLVEFHKKDGVPGLALTSIEEDLLYGRPLLSGLGPELLKLKFFGQAVTSCSRPSAASYNNNNTRKISSGWASLCSWHQLYSRVFVNSYITIIYTASGFSCIQGSLSQPEIIYQHTLNRYSCLVNII